MQVHIFEGTGSNYGFTQDATGANLPSNLGPWKLLKVSDFSGDDPKRIGVSSSDVIAGIERDGYYLTNAKITISTK